MFIHICAFRRPHYTETTNQELEKIVAAPWAQLLVGPIIRLVDHEAAKRLPAESLRFPILPNSISKDKDELLRPKPSFPFSNCFHTIGSELHVRVEMRWDPKQPGYKRAGRVELSFEKHREIKSSLPCGTIRRSSTNHSNLREVDLDDEWLDPGVPCPKYVRPGIEELDSSNWGDPIVDMWLQLDEQFGESCIPANTQKIGEEIEAVQQ